VALLLDNNNNKSVQNLVDKVSTDLPPLPPVVLMPALLQKGPLASMAHLAEMVVVQAWTWASREDLLSTLLNDVRAGRQGPPLDKVSTLPSLALDLALVLALGHHLHPHRLPDNPIRALLHRDMVVIVMDNSSNVDRVRPADLLPRDTAEMALATTRTLLRLRLLARGGTRSIMVSMAVLPTVVGLSRSASPTIEQPQ
jgi:hypothetical protein